MRIVALVSTVIFCLLGLVDTARGSEWEPEREYSSIAIQPNDEVRYGGYTVAGRAYVDVLDRAGRVVRTIQIPTPEGFTTRLFDLDTSEDVLVVSYHLSGGDPFFDPNLFVLSLYRNGEETARGAWAGNPYGQTRKVALNDDYVFVDYADSGVPEGVFVYAVDDIPAVGNDANLIGGESIPRTAVVDTNALHPDRYPEAADFSASNAYLYLYWDAEYLVSETSVDVFTMGLGPEFQETIELSGLDTTSLVAADHWPAGGFVVSGPSDPNVISCSVSTHGPDGSIEDCFLARPGGAEMTSMLRADPFDVDACGGIVMADAEADNGQLIGYKLIPSSRDPGCLVDALDSTFRTEIQAIGRSGITKGCNPPDNDLFCPGDFVTRGQMAAFLHRALSGVLVATGDAEFVDDDGNTFEADIEWLGGTGITRGCNPPVNDRFCPGDFVTRGQMAAFLHRALGD